MEKMRSTPLQLPALFLCLCFSFSAYAQLLTPAPYAPDKKINYVRSWEPHAAEQNAAALVTRPLRDVKQTTQYLDGLGRPLQTVSKQGSLPTSGIAADLFQAVLYDDLGREAYKFLPGVAGTTGGNTSVTDGGFKMNPFQQDSVFNKAFYAGENFFYTQTLFEPSPLNRPVSIFPQGNSWVGNMKGTTTRYQTGASDSVRLWTIEGDDVLPVSSGFYSNQEMTKNAGIDERGFYTFTLTDRSGRIMIKKVQATSNASASAAYHNYYVTQYLYDAIGNLRFVISPKAIQELLANGWNMNAAIADGLCFRYQYDTHNRMTVKKVPGAGAVEMVYDARDRLIMSRDSNMRANGTWMVTVYENNFNRPVKTGLLTDGQSRSYHETAAATSSSYPSIASGFELMSETYYDDYSWVPGSGSGLSASLNTTGFGSSFVSTYNTSPEFAQPLSASAAVKGRVTGSRVKIIGTNDFLFYLNIYDSEGRVIQVQSGNITGGTDITTTQYDWSGKVIRSLVQHEKSGANAQQHTILTKNIFDDAGRILQTIKNIDDKGDKTILTNSYDAMGLLSAKNLGNGTENLNYEYNIRGWLLGINRDYVKDASNHYFGFELAYDKPANIISGASYNLAQLTGNIAGTSWKSKGDGEKRKFDYDYDPANRLLRADFTQYTDGSFNTTAGMNFSVLMGDGVSPGTAYDANGNILNMKQWGKKGSGLTSDELATWYESVLIDDLSYNYYPVSNQLLNVNDAASDPATLLGDFRTSLQHPQSGVKNSGTTDYTYDGNGNLVKDLNKDLVNYSGTDGIVYNHLNIPAEITVKKDGSSNKGKITYTYDAAGNKIKKTTTEGARTTTTLYLGAFNYVNDTLQFASHEEGRIRKTDTSFTYDYFLKDHLGNTRAVVTEEHKSDGYPAASMETASAAVEEALYSNLDSTRSDLPPGYPNDGYITPNTKVARLNGNGNKIGPAILLRVMAGDSVNIRASSWYRLNGGTTGSPQDPFTEIVSLLAKSVSTSGYSKISYNELQDLVIPHGLSNMLYLRNSQFSVLKPKAYLSWILLNDKFEYVSESSGFEQVGEDTILTTWVKTGIPMQKNGYLYVYTGNESPMDVFFDNLQVTHTRGPLLEETHYYPFGLTMAGISSKAAGKLENKKDKFQGQEYDDDLGINYYGFKWRNHDPQIGRFIEIDPLSDKYVYNSTYAFSENKVTAHVELEGLESWSIQGLLKNSSGLQNMDTKTFLKRGVEELKKPETYTGSIQMLGQIAAPIGLAIFTEGALSGVSMMAEGNAIRGTRMASELTPTSVVETGAEGSAASPKPAPSYIVDSKGTTYPVPEGSVGPTPVESGKGVQFTGGTGGANGQVTDMRLMDPVPAKGKAPGYPDGYIKYTNAQGQGVNPYTGQTGSKPATHFPINGNTTPAASDATKVKTPVILPPKP